MGYNVARNQIGMVLIAPLTSAPSKEPRTQKMSTLAINGGRVKREKEILLGVII